jgi:hypothetical protein
MGRVTSAPGHVVTIGDRASSPLAAASTSNGFLVGVCEKGPTDRPIKAISLADAVDSIGERVATNPYLYDAVDCAFREGASVVYIGRAVGAESATATHTAVDAGGKISYHVNAKSPGAWGNNIEVAITLTAGSVVLVVKLNGTTVETSPSLGTNAEVIEWGKSSEFVTITAGEAEALDAKTQAVKLENGKDDIAGVGTGQIEAALNVLTADLGPGQVAAPGFTSEAIHKALLVHCSANNRRGLLDDPIESTSGELVGHATALRGPNARFGCLLGSWAYVPGVSLGTERKVPYSGIQMGLIARAEAEGNNPNRAAAGPRGKSRYATGLVKLFTDAQRGELDAAGVIASILVRGIVTTYGNVTLVNQTTEPNWKSFSASRLVMAVAAKAGQILESYDFEQIDGHGYVFKQLQGDLSGGACMPFYLENALYGTDPAEAFFVNTGPDVNTPTSISNEEIKAQIGLRVSPTASFLEVEVVKVPTTESL